MLVCEYSRPFLSPCDDESIPQGGVHGEDRTAVGLCHHPHQEVLPPHEHVSIYCTSERQVVLDKTNTYYKFCKKRFIYFHFEDEPEF